MANNGNFLKCILIGLILLSPNIIFCQTKIFTTDSINFNEWNYNQRKIIRKIDPWFQSIHIIAESNNEIFYSQNLFESYSQTFTYTPAKKLFNGKNATLAVDVNFNTYIIYEDNSIKCSFNYDSASIIISDSSEIGSFPVADCDKEGNVHIVYGVKDSSDNDETYLSSLKYVKVSNNQRQISSVIYNMEEDKPDTLVNYTIATDLLFMDETVFLAYQLSNDSIYVKYSVDYGENWELSIAFPGTNPSLSVGFGHTITFDWGYEPFPIPSIDTATTYPVILFMDTNRNLLYHYARGLEWYANKKLHSGPIDYACIDDVGIPYHPFGYSYIFQKNGVLFHAFTNFRERIIMDTITNNAIVS